MSLFFELNSLLLRLNSLCKDREMIRADRTCLATLGCKLTWQYLNAGLHYDDLLAAGAP